MKELDTKYVEELVLNSSLKDFWVTKTKEFMLLAEIVIPKSCNFKTPTYIFKYIMSFSCNAPN